MNVKKSIVLDKKAKQLIKEYERYAKEIGFKLNPNKKIVEGVIKGLFEDEKNYGKKYCPCRRVTGNKEEDKKIICPCIYHKQEIKTQGHCHCQLFVK